MTRLPRNPQPYITRIMHERERRMMTRLLERVTKREPKHPLQTNKTLYNK